MSGIWVGHIKYSRTISMVWLALFLTGCLYIPPLGRQISQEDLEFINVGSTTKSEVLERLGEPTALNEARFLVTDVESDRGFFIIIAAGISLGGKIYRILLEFDENDVVTKFELESSRKEGGTTESTWPRAKDSDVRLALSPREVLTQDREFISVAFSPDGKFVAAGDRWNRVLLWDLETGGEPIVFKGKRSCFFGAYAGRVWGVAFSPDGSMLAAGGMDGIAKLWDLTTGKELLSFKGHGTPSCWVTQAVFSIAFAPDGKALATGDKHGAVKLWDAATGRELITLKEHSSIVDSVAFSPDGKMLATASRDDSVKLWDLETGRELVSLSRSEGSIGAPSITFSPNGRLLAINRGVYVEMWRITPRNERTPPDKTGIKSPPWKPLRDLATVFILPAFSDGKWPDLAVAFSADGRKLIAGAGAAVMWDVATSRERWRFVPSGTQYDNNAVSYLAFSPDGRTLATAGNNGVALWRVPR